MFIALVFLMYPRLIFLCFSISYIYIYILHITAAQYLKDNKEALKNLSVPLESIQFDDAPYGVHVPSGYIYATYVHEGNYSITYLIHSPWPKPKIY